MKSYIQSDIKDYNRKTLFNILLENPSIAKVELAKMTTMSQVTIGKNIDFFESIGLVTQNGENREGAGGLGRKRVLYNFNPNCYTSIGIQIIGYKLNAVLINLKNEVVEEFNLPSEIYIWEESAIDEIVNVFEYFKEKSEQLNSQIISVGIAIDGAINRTDKTFSIKINSTERRSFEYVELLHNISKRIGVDVSLENEINSSVFAEFHNKVKNNVDVKDLLEISLVSGIGAGIILNEKLYRGNKISAGELESMCFDINYTASPTSVGWLESKLLPNFLEEKFDFKFTEIDKIKEESRQECIKYVSQYVALAICNTVSLLAIQDIVLSGKIVNAFKEELLEKIEESIFKYTGWKLNIRLSELKNASALGVGMLAMENEIENIFNVSI